MGVFATLLDSQKRVLVRTECFQNCLEKYQNYLQKYEIVLRKAPGRSFIFKVPELFFETVKNAQSDAKISGTTSGFQWGRILLKNKC